MQMLVHIGLLYFVTEMKLFISKHIQHIEHIPEEIKEFIGNKNIKANIFLFSPHDFKKNGNITLSYFKNE